jgi:glycerol-1-phosphate dehydrogenase [NAD(P)+]
MSSLLTHVKLHTDECTCGNHHPIQIEEIFVEEHALQKIGGFLEKKGLHQIVMVCDKNTYAVAGKSVVEQLTKETYSMQVIQLQPNSQGDIIADEISIVHILASVQSNDIDCLLAVGSGTIHDLVRFVASRINKPFLSVPTAPSVDGFTSLGAPIILRGEKKTLVTIAPIVIFADLAILSEAPKELIAAGFGDMVAKYISLTDWKFSHEVAGEPYCEATANLTKEALDMCIAERDSIARGDKQGIRTLMLALIQSGLAMSVFGQSHPASGAEHHLSHYWEMKFIQEGRKQILHGAKVGVATIQISQLYHRIAQLELSSGILRKMNKESEHAHRIKKNWLEIKSWIETIPTPDELITWFKLIGAPHSAIELDLEPSLIEMSLRDAYKVRDRYTILRAYCES